MGCFAFGEISLETEDEKRGCVEKRLLAARYGRENVLSTRGG